MLRDNLTELASNPDFISGIYNYCDRWCERCPFTSRCLVYATEQQDDDNDPKSRDLNNEAFWKKLASIFAENRSMITAWAEEAGIDLSKVDEDALAHREKRRAKASQDQLTVAAKDYAGAVTQWFTELDQIIKASDLGQPEAETDETDQITDAREVIHRYQYQIAVKFMRALSSLSDEDEWQDEDDSSKDSDGSAKVALIGIDRSISAWRLMQICLPEMADSVIPLILGLERLRQNGERRFPGARDFIRPGFDELLGEAN